MERLGLQGWRGDRPCSCSFSYHHRASKCHLHWWLVHTLKPCFQDLAFLPHSWGITYINPSLITASLLNMFTNSSRNLSITSLRVLRIQQKQLSKKPFNFCYLWMRSKYHYSFIFQENNFIDMNRPRPASSILLLQFLYTFSFIFMIYLSMPRLEHLPV